MSARLIRHLCSATLAALLASACRSDTYPSEPLTGAVVTIVDSGPALRSARTFVLPDTVLRISQSGGALSPAMAHELIVDIRDHFLALGWTQIANAVGSRPDVVVLVAVSTRIQTGLIYSNWFSSWGYLPYWGAGVDPSWAWGYPGAAVPYAYQAGTLVVAMIEVRAPRSDTKTIPLLWAAGLDGVIGDATTTTRVHAGIDQAFEQSPYLRLN